MTRKLQANLVVGFRGLVSRHRKTRLGLVAEQVQEELRVLRQRMDDLDLTRQRDEHVRDLLGYDRELCSSRDEHAESPRHRPRRAPNRLPIPPRRAPSPTGHRRERRRSSRRRPRDLREPLGETGGLPPLPPRRSARRRAGVGSTATAVARGSEGTRCGWPRRMRFPRVTRDPRREAPPNRGRDSGAGRRRYAVAKGNPAHGDFPAVRTI